MALVAYESSGEESEGEVDELCEEGKSIFNILPEPQTEDNSNTIEEVEDEFLFKKEPILEVRRKRTVITVPSLSQFDKEEDPKTKPKEKVYANTASCKLFHILPPPKHSASEESVLKLIPKCLSKKNVTGKSQVELAREKARKKRQELLKSTAKYNSDSDEDDINGSDFFSLDKAEEPLIGTQMNHELVSNKSYAEEHPCTQGHINMNPEDYIAEDFIIDPDVVKPIDEPINHEVQLSKEDIMKIDKTTKRKAEDIEFIDVNESDLLLKPEERIKALSVEKNHVSFTKQCAPLAKKKHQITYLAQLAKEKEVELKDMWAQNRVSRRQTQAKYGF